MELGRISDGNTWIQVTAKTGSKDVRSIKADLKRSWKHVWCSNLGHQVTQYGIMKITMINGRNDSLYGQPGPNPAKEE